MTVVLNLPAEIENRLQLKARASGMTVETYLEEIVKSTVSEREALNSRQRPSLAEIFAESPFKGLNMEFPRERDELRTLEP